MSANRHHATQQRRLRGGELQRDGAAVAVADEQAAVNASRVEHLRQDQVGLDVEIARPRRSGPRTRLCVTGAIVGETAEAGTRAQRLGEAAPQLDAPESFVKKHERRRVGVGLGGRARSEPAAAEPPIG
jgi:hypothetical protein